MAIQRVTLLVLAFVLVPARPVQAVHHLMKVGEVLLSSGGDASIQFIELEDPFAESFPDGTYRLEVFDAAAQALGSVALDVPPQTTRFLVATGQAASAFQVGADAELSVALPMDGQACFSRTVGTKIHCLAWGCVDTLILASASTGASPPDGLSLQRQQTGVYQVAAPTPGADNAAGADVEPCPEPSRPVLVLAALLILCGERSLRWGSARGAQAAAGARCLPAATRARAIRLHGSSG
jgi:hypothetical protein